MYAIISLSSKFHILYYFFLMWWSFTPWFYWY